MNDPVTKGDRLPPEEPAPQEQQPAEPEKGEAEELGDDGKPKLGGGSRDHKPGHKPPVKPALGGGSR